MLAPIPAIGLALMSVQAAAAPNDRPAQGQEPRVSEAPADRFGVIDGGQLQVSSGTDDDNMTISIALPTGPSQANRFSLTASTPLHGDDDARPASLDALANGARVTLRFGHFGIGRATPDARAREIVTEQQDRCVAAQPNPQDPAHRLIGGVCADSNKLVHDLALPHYREYLAHMLHTGAFDWGIDATVGVNEFDWIDPVTFASRKAQHTDWSLAGHLAYYWPGLVAIATVSYQRAYEAVKEQLLCPPNPANPATDCRTARGAGPTVNENFLLSAGFRYRFVGSDGRLLQLAVAPQVNYDVIDDVWGVDVPIYFIPGGEGGLTGGLRFGYRSDREDHFSVGVFAGAAFGLWQQ